MQTKILVEKKTVMVLLLCIAMMQVNIGTLHGKMLLRILKIGTIFRWMPVS